MTLRRLRGASARLLGRLALGALALPGGAQSREFPGAEGPLDNDCFLPTHGEATALIARGDGLYAQLLAKDSADPGGRDARFWTEVFESWHGALDATRSGDSVPPRPTGPDAGTTSPWPDPYGTAVGQPPRATEGVEFAVLRRLSALTQVQRNAWRGRFESLAAQTLEAAGPSPELLSEVERGFPATRSAVSAAARLAETSLEQGRLAAGRDWLARARRQLELSGLDDPALGAALDRRMAVLTQLAPPDREPAAEPWTRATTLEPAGQVALPQLVPTGPPEPGRGIQPGMVFLDDGRGVVQAGNKVILLHPSESLRVGEFDPGKLLAGRQTGMLFSSSEAPGWPQLPATDGRALVLVHGRRSDSLSNALVCVTVAVDPIVGGPTLPRLRWALVGGERLDGTGASGSPAGGVAPLDLSRSEFQPGPVIRDGTVFVQVRESPAGDGERGGGARSPGALLPLLSGDGEVRTWVMAVDLASGRPRWARFVAKGVDLRQTLGRFALNAPGLGAGQPLVLAGPAGERIFAGTHTGAGVLLDAVDGRVVWSFKNRRRAGAGDGWPGWRPPVLADPPTLLWGPADSDHLYWLRAEPDLTGASLLRFPPRAIGEAVGPLACGGGEAGGSPFEALLLSRAGRRSTLSAWDPRSGGRLDSSWIGEPFSGAGLAAPRRALFATDRGLLLVDRERELFLLDYALLGPAGNGRGGHYDGGSVHAGGGRVFVVGPTRVWVYDVR